MPSSRAIASRCSTPLVEPPVAATDGDGVLDRLAGDDLRGAHVVAHQLHDQPPGLLGRVALARVERGDAVQARRADAQELERHRHRVGGELAAAGARAGAGDVLERVQLLARRSCPAACAPTASNTSWMVTSRPRNVPGRDRAAVEDEPGDVEPASAITAAGIVLSQPTRQTRPSNRWPRADQLDRVGDHLAARPARRACPRCPSRRRRRPRSC